MCECKSGKIPFNNGEVILKMISNPEIIKPFHTWTDEDKKMADIDRYRFNYVTRDEITALWDKKPEWDDVNKWWYIDGETITIPDSNYPSLEMSKTPL